MNGLERFWFKHVKGNVRRLVYEDPLILERIGDSVYPSYEDPTGFVKLNKFPSVVVQVTLAAPEVEIVHGLKNRDETIKDDFNYWKYDFFGDSLLDDPRNLRGFFIDKTEDRNGAGSRLTTGYLTYVSPTEFRSAKKQIKILLEEQGLQAHGPGAFE
ncbi:MAG: hypothetical protein WCK29_02225 [archaeon]